MTATNHALTGAVIALGIRQPMAAVPLAFLSHFVLDALPHFGIPGGDVFERNRRAITKVVFAVDAVLVIVAFLWLGLMHHQVSNWLLLGCAFVAYLPDVLWLPRFIREVRTHAWRPGGWFIRFHQGIQWGERPWGVVVELVWLVGMGIGVVVLA